MIRKKAPLFKKLILHVGSHKTGTSAIQKAVDSRFGTLLGQSILYPRTGQWHDRSHHHWALAIWDETGSDGKLETLLRDLERERDETGTNPETILISTELIEKVPCKRSRHPILTSFLSYLAEDVECVYFVRRQDLLAESVFKQWVKDYNIRLKSTIPSFIEQQKAGMNYFEIAKAWESLENVSRMHVRTNALISDPVRAFFDIINVELEEVEQKKITDIVNPTLDGQKLEFKYFLNFLNISEVEDQKLMKIINRLDISNETLSMFSEEDRIEFIETFNKTNDRLSERYGAEFFHQDIPRRDRMFHNLSGKDLEGMLQRLAGLDPQLTWTVYDKIRRLVQSD